jgi:hypothetical protein
MERYAALVETAIGIDIRRHLGEPNTLFVFPSQDGSDSWAQALVKSGACKAVALDRFFGFENFLRHCATLREHEGFRTTQQIDKWVWALSVLTSRRDGTDPARALPLMRILPPEEASTTHLARLVSLIPGLYEVEALKRSTSGPSALPYSFLREEFKEIELLARHYRGYLDRNHLSDGHLAPLVLPSGAEVRAYGLREDFARLGLPGGPLGDAAGSRLVFPDVALPGELRGIPTNYHEFDSFLAEIEQVFTKISVEIARGNEPEDIAISVCRLNAQKAAWIRQTAGDFGIPVSIRWGEPLSLTPFGRLLHAIQNAAREGLTLDSLDAFSAVGSIKSRNPEGWNTLRHTALRAHIPSPSPNAAYVHRLWRESGQIGICTPACAQMYQKLWQDITDIVHAESFSRLYGQILRFLEHWIDTGQFSANLHTDRSMRMALDELQSWMEYEDRIQRGRFLPFEVYMATLGTKSYIPLLEENAVHVYDFKTASGLAAISQYVVGASQAGLASSLENQSALPAELSALGGPRMDANIEELLAMHHVAHTEYSFAREGFEGYEVAYPLLGPPSVGTATGGRRLRTSTKSPSHPVSRTHEYSNPPSINPAVSARFLQATRSFDFEKQLAVFSPYSLTDRTRCAFRWFAQRISLEDVYSDDDTARIIGDFLHETYQRTIKNLPERLSETEAATQFLGAFEAAVHVTLGKIFAEHGPGLRPTLTTLLDRARHRLGELWNFEREAFSGYEREGFEFPVSYAFKAEGALFNGRIDCVFSRTDESLGNVKCYIIVDYKKNRVPSLSEMRPRATESGGDLEAEGGLEAESEEENLALREIQIPSYALILEMLGGIVEGALYWSMEKTEALAYIRPPAAPKIRSAYTRREETVPVRAAVREMLAHAATAVKRGELLDPASDREACDGCAFKPLCRYWYFLEL